MKATIAFFANLFFAILVLFAPISAAGAYTKLNRVAPPVTVDQWVQTKSGLSRDKTTLYIRYVQDSALHYNVDPKIILAIILKESTFNHSAVACSKRMPCVGLMQVTAGIHNNKGRFKNLSISNPRRNIDLGVSIYQQELKRCRGNVKCALEQYNRSPKRRQYAAVVLKYASTIPSM